MKVAGAAGGTCIRLGAAPMPPAANDPSENSLQPGDTLRDGRYAISGRLGEGGQATTFEAVDKSVGRRVTVKRFRVRGASSWK